jgi:prepilin-type N-terminal cleavage/methylation domain-containing protein
VKNDMTQDLLKTKKDAFTLVELLTAIAIIGVLAGIAIPTAKAYLIKAEYAALQTTLRLLMDSQDIYFVENDRFYPGKGSINIGRGQEKAMKHGIRLAMDTEEIPETITADERKLKQVIYNLLSNAVKFTPDGGEVRVEARSVDCAVRPGLRRGDPKDLRIIDPRAERRKTADTNLLQCVELSVSDTGIGIRPEDRERIFSPFEQVESSTSRRYQGTGLGLSLTKDLVELHGGMIWAESEGEGKGSAFHVIIPVTVY